MPDGKGASNEFGEILEEKRKVLLLLISILASSLLNIIMAEGFSHRGEITLE